MPKQTKLTIPRRHFLQGATAAGLAAATMPITNAVWSQTGKVLRARAYADLDQLDPGFYQNAYNVDVMNCIYSKLVHYVPGREWKWELEAAEQLEKIDDTHIRFKLRPGIIFTGGYGEMTAEDVKFSYERIKKHDSPIKGDWRALDHVEVIDKYTGVIVLSEPFEPLWTITLPYGAGHIVSKAAVLKKKSDGGNFGLDPPAFSGPYVLAEWKPNQYVRLTRNPDYKGPAQPGFDEIRILPMKDEATAEIAYEARDLDFTNISLASLARYKKKPPANTRVEEYPSLAYVWLGLNVQHEKLKDINVRRAIQWAVNVRQIMEAAYLGEAAPATGIIAPGLIGHRKASLIPPQGDAKKARDFLQKAGVKSLDLAIDLLNTAKFKTIAEMIQAQLAQIGIKLQVNVQDSGSFWTMGMEKEGERWKSVQLIINRFSMAPDPYYATEWFTCEQIGKWNWERFCSERFDELHGKAVSVADPEQRAKMYHEMQDIMEESGAYRFLTHEGSPIAYRENVVQPAVRPDSRPLFRSFKMA